MYDVVIIGAGVSGSAVARVLSRYEMKVAVLEKDSDVCEGTSKANSGIVHAGFDATPGSLKALLNVRGNELMEQWAEELDFPFKRNGSMVLMFEEADREKLLELYQKGRINEVKNLQILSPADIKKIEPQITEQVAGALYAPTGGIVCPFNLNIAMAENACENGVEFHFNTKVERITPLSEEEEGYLITTNQGDFETKLIVNAAGVYADVFHNMVSDRKIHITARKGEYCLMDKKAGNLVEKTIFQLPSKMGKGILVTPTVHGNLLVGPSALDVEDKEENNTTQSGMEGILQTASRSVKSLPTRSIITSFAGLRAHEDGNDFIMGEVWDAPGFYDVAGMESPGLTCAPAIGEYVGGMVAEHLEALKKEDYKATRKAIPNMALASEEERKRLIEEDPAYANVICRCELVTEGEIVSAIRRPLGATTLDGIKRRTRAGMGRCQAGFCSPKTVEILARELQVDINEITKCGGESHFLLGFNKEII